MIKIICIAVFSFFLTGSIYEISIEKADGTGLALDQFQEKKMLVVILPSMQSDSGTIFLQQLDSVSKAQTNYVFIAVPSYEEGYNDAVATETQQWYRSIVDTQVLITKGMYTHKIGNSQHPLFAWLTNINLNTHFDEDVQGEGSKFFINENGELVGELWGNISFGSSVMQRVFNK